MSLGLGKSLKTNNTSRFFNPAQIPNLALWLDASDLSTITKDGSNYVSEWRDKILGTKKVVQATGSKQPILVNNAIRFDGVDDFIQGSGIANIPQPFTEFLVLKQLSWTVNDRIIDHNSFILQNPSSPRIMCYGGITSTSKISQNQLKGVAIIWKGANTSIQVYGDSPEVIGSNSSQFSGLKLGGDTGYYANIELSEYIIYAGEKTTSEINGLLKYFSRKWGTS